MHETGQADSRISVVRRIRIARRTSVLSDKWTRGKAAYYPSIAAVLSLSPSLSLSLSSRARGSHRRRITVSHELRGLRRQYDFLQCYVCCSGVKEDLLLLSSMSTTRSLLRSSCRWSTTIAVRFGVINYFWYEWVYLILFSINPCYFEYKFFNKKLSLLFYYTFETFKIHV